MPVIPALKKWCESQNEKSHEWGYRPPSLEYEAQMQEKREMVQELTPESFSPKTETGVAIQTKSYPHICTNVFSIPISKIFLWSY